MKHMYGSCCKEIVFKTDGRMEMNEIYFVYNNITRQQDWFNNVH